MTHFDASKSNTSATLLGRTGPRVFPIGLGCMAFSGPYGPADEAESIATIRHAIDRGISLLDTGDFYGMGHNELLVRRAIEGLRDKVQLSVKFGAMRGPDGAALGIDNRPSAVKNFVCYSLRRLGVEVIDIYRPARLDPQVPIEETVGAIADLVRGGYVRHVGLSELGPEMIRRACAVHPVVDLQIEYSIATRGAESAIFAVLKDLEMSATLYGVFARGLLTGSKPSAPGDFRKHMPRFSGEHGAKNATAVEKLHEFAQQRAMTPAQVALGWVLAKQPGFVPIVGARTRAQLDDAMDVLDRPLHANDIVAIDALMAAHQIEGPRYPTQHMRILDSER